MTIKSAGILGMGIGLPDRTLNNIDLEKIVDTSDEWIKKRTGIDERRILEDDRNVSDIAAEAGLEAIKDAGLSSADIDCVVVATGSPELIWPATACLAMKKMGLNGQAAYDIQAACSGFVYGFDLVAQTVSTGRFKNVLLIAAEAMSRYLDWKDRSTCVLFGDAAAAVVIGQVESAHGLIASDLGADVDGTDMLQIPNSGSAIEHDQIDINSKQTIEMNGGEVFKFAVRIIPETVKKALDKAGLGIGDVKYIIPHQANQRITDAAAEKIGVSVDKMVGNISRFGNTGAASIPLALYRLYKDEKIEKGDIIACVGFGAGLTWGANIVKWSKTS